MSAKTMDAPSMIAALQHLWPDFELSKNNELKPTSHTAIKFYTRFICGELQIQIDELQRTLIENASCPDAFADILSVYALYMCTETVIRKLGLNELIQTFGLNDLLKPMQKKFKMSLMLLLNCVIYVTALQELMEDIKSKVLQALQSRKDVHEQIDSIKEKINGAVLAHLKHKQKNDEWRKRRDSILIKVQEAQQVHNTLQEEIKQEKLNLNRTQDEYAALEVKLNHLLVSEDKVKTQIIDDIPSIACEKERLIKERNELLAESADYHNTMQQKMQTIKCLQENHAHVNTFFKTTPLNKLLDNYEILDNCKSEIESVQSEIKSLEEYENIDPNSFKQIQDLNKRIEQDIQMDTKTHEDRIKQFEREIQEIKDEMNQEETRIYKLKELSKKLDIKIQDMKELARQHEDNIEKQNAYYDEKYKMILELKGRLDNKVMSIIEKIKNEVNSKK